MTDWHIPGFTSTGSKRPEALFGLPGGPARMVRAAGCQVWDEHGRAYVDYVMALGAVALGYGHPEVSRAAAAAIEAGVVGPLPPVLEEELAAALSRRIPWLESVRFFKTGAEGVSAAVRLARVATGRDLVLGCGYHGWHDWSQGGGVEGVPGAVRGLFGELPFNDSQRATEEIRARAGRLACVVVEPLVVAEPTREWLETLRRETERAGAVLVFDEIKTGFRVAVGGATERYGAAGGAGLRPDLAVYGKAMANGFPLAVVGGRRQLMDLVSRTWISSTLATEAVSLAAAKATLEVFDRDRVCEHLHRAGTRLLHGLHRLQRDHGGLVTGVCGVAEMCFLSFVNEDASRRVAVECARRGVLFKRTAYNFVSLAHDDATLDATLGTLEESLRAATTA